MTAPIKVTSKHIYKDILFNIIWFTEAQSSLAYQGMPQPFSSPLGAQPFYTSSSLGMRIFN